MWDFFIKLRQYVWLWNMLIGFYTGWYICHLVETSKAQKLLIQQQESNIKQLKNLKQINDRSNELFIQKESALQIQINDQLIKNKLKDEELANVKDKLNRTNHVNAMLVRAIDNTNAMPTITATPTKPISANASISPYEFTKWAKGLREHDTICTIKYNAILNYYNDQRNLFNGFIVND